MAGALAKSLNLVSAYLIKQLGPAAVADFANNKVGFSVKIPAYPSICLGTPEIPLYDMLQAYTMFAARGIITKPIYITRIEDRNGNILETTAPEKREVISENESYVMTKMMEGVTGPGGTSARLRFRYGIKGQVAGKTGTTNDNTDGWFMGFTPQLLAGAWVGCENNFLHFSTTANGQGANTGLPIWAYFFQKLYADPTLKIDPNATFPIPAAIDSQDYSNVQENYKSEAEAEDQGNGSASDYIDVGDYGEPTKPAEKPKEKEEPKKENNQQQPTPKAVLPPKNNQ